MANKTGNKADDMTIPWLDLYWLSVVLKEPRSVSSSEELQLLIYCHESSGDELRRLDRLSCSEIRVAEKIIINQRQPHAPFRRVWLITDVADKNLHNLIASLRSGRWRKICGEWLRWWKSGGKESFPISQFVHVLLIHTTTVLIANLIWKLML